MRHRNLRSGKLPLKLIIILVVLLGGGVFAAMCFMGGSGDAQGRAEESEGTEAKETEEAEAPAQTVSLGEEFLVNIRSGGSQLRYLKAQISLVVREVKDEEGKQKKKEGHGHGDSDESEVELPAASLRYARDVTIAVLSNQQFETLRTAEGKRKLKATLQQKLDAVLEHYQVSDVLFTSFVMQ